MKMKRTLDDARESAVVELDAAVANLNFFWETHFMTTEPPKGWENRYHEISAQMTALRLQLERVSETLMTSFGMGSEYFARDLANLSEKAKELWPELAE